MHTLNAANRFSCITKLASGLFVCWMAVVPSTLAAEAADLLSEQQWQQVDKSVERGLAWLATQQQRDGSFPTLPHGQPGVTSLCVMAFLSHGHLPGEGPYGEQVQKAVDFVISCQKRSGILAFTAPNGLELSRNVGQNVGSSSAYNHAISALVLSETYGIQSDANANKIRPVVRKALDVTLEMQKWAINSAPSNLGQERNP